MRLGEVMSAPVVTIPGATPLAECAVRLAAGRMRHLPVVDAAGACTGIVTDFEIQQRGRLLDATRWVPRDAAAGTLVAAQVEREVEVVRAPDDALWEALEALDESSQDLVLVCERGRPVGILTEHDVVRLASQRTGARALPAPRRTLPLIEAATTALEARSWMARRRERHGLVIRDGRLVGVLSLRDVALEDYVRDDVTAGEVCKAPITLEEEVQGEWDTARIAALLYEKKIGCLPVVDAQGRPIRLVSRRDLVRALAAALRPAE